MPKKQPKNAFYFFMLNFREEQKNKGVEYINMSEVANAAGQPWKDAPPHVRGRFEAISKREKEKANIPLQKFTSTGVSLAEIAQRDKDLRDAEDSERRDIQNMVKLKSFNQAILSEDIYLMDVNYYCKVGSSYLVGELAILRFNVRDGIKDHYHELVNPGQIPTGYAFDMKTGREEYGLLIVDDDPELRCNYIQILANIIDYLRQHNREDRPERSQIDLKTLPPMYTLPDKVAPVQDFIQQLCNRAAEDESIFRIYKLNTLMFAVINSISEEAAQGLPRESLAFAHLKQDTFKYTPGIGCAHHDKVDKTDQCCRSRVTRWAYSLLDRVLPAAGIEPIVGKHLPFDYNMEGIHLYQEYKSTRPGPSVANVSFPGPSNSSVDTSLNDSGASAIAARPPRTHTPLRKPNTDFSKMLRPAPEITESEFPPIMGRSRGRGLPGSFKDMNIKE